MRALDRVEDVRHRVVGPARQRAPTRRARTQVERLAGAGQRLGRPGQAALPLVAPVEDRDVARQVDDELRVPAYHVAPDLQRAAVAGGQGTDAFHKVEPDARFAFGGN